MIAFVCLTAALSAPTCHCPSGFAFDDNTVTRAFDAQTAYGTGCAAIVCEASTCVNGVVGACTPQCIQNNACCGSCNLGYYLNTTQKQCAALACPDSTVTTSINVTDGVPTCECLPTHYRTGLVFSGAGTLLESNVRTIQITSARPDTATYDLQQCTPVQPTCRAVPHCTLAQPRCVDDNLPHTGVCRDSAGQDMCEIGYAAQQVPCEVDSNVTLCDACQVIECANGTVIL